MKVLIFCQDLNNFNHTHKVLGFLSLKAHSNFSKTEKPIFLNLVFSSKNKVFEVLNNFEQTEFKQEKETFKNKIFCVHDSDF